MERYSFKIDKIKPRKVIKMIILIIVALLVSLILSITLFLNLAPVFGDGAEGTSLDKITNSKNYDGKKFINLVETQLSTRDTEESSPNLMASISDLFFPAKEKNPQIPLPSKIFNKKELENGTFSWMGHSTVLMRNNNVTIITDPVFYRASPVAFIGDSFKLENPITAADLPKIDVVLISHDHYDHLDYKAIQDLSSQVDVFLVPLGIKAHLLRWGVEENKIIERDWYESSVYKGVDFTLAPSRHFSGRGLTNRNSTLWGSWIIKSDSLNVYFSGDGGYSEEFEKIGREYGPFDIVFLENGAYDKGWSQIHMMPEEVVQASIDLKTKVLLPIHWSKFDLAHHNWDEPINRTFNESERRNVTVSTPMIGEIFNLNNLPQEKWWEELRK